MPQSLRKQTIPFAWTSLSFLSADGWASVVVFLIFQFSAQMIQKDYQAMQYKAYPLY